MKGKKSVTAQTMLFHSRTKGTTVFCEIGLHSKDFANSCNFVRIYYVVGHILEQLMCIILLCSHNSSMRWILFWPHFTDEGGH